jgi:hypothetical protein
MAAVVEGPVEIIILVNGSYNFKFNVNKLFLSIQSINFELSFLKVINFNVPNKYSVVKYNISELFNTVININLLNSNPD